MLGLGGACRRSGHLGVIAAIDIWRDLYERVCAKHERWATFTSSKVPWTSHLHPTLTIALIVRMLLVLAIEDAS